MSDRIYAAGDRIADRFELTQPLGKGAFGVVWRGIDHANDQAPVAIKFLFDKYRRDNKMLGRFVQEAKILEKLSHPSIASPIAWSADGDAVFLAMELIDGETLDRRFEGNSRDNSPVPKQGIAWICDQLCSAVGFAHDHNVVHRDMKPKNVMVNRRGSAPFLKVLDFGIAKMLVGSEIDPTTAGRVLGSVLYISPEQVLSQTLDHRADIFSLGTIMFELITLRRAWARDEDGDPHPFHVPIAGGETNSHVAVLRRIARGGRPRATELRSDISLEVDEVLHRAMAIAPADRYDSAAAFAVALRAALLDEPSAHDVHVAATLVDDEALPTLTAADDVRSVQNSPFDELATESGSAHVGTPPRVFDAPAQVSDESLPAPIPRRSPGTIWFLAATIVVGLVLLLLSR